MHRIYHRKNITADIPDNLDDSIIRRVDQRSEDTDPP